MPYEMVHNSIESIQSNGRIKKSTFWPYSVRVLVLIVVKWIFYHCDFLIHHSNMLYLFLPFLALKFMILHLFQNFGFFGLYFDAWIGTGQNIVSTPDPIVAFVVMGSII